VTGVIKVAGLLAYSSIRRSSIGVTVLTILILALLATNLMFVRGLLDGLVWSANEKLIDTYTSDITVEPGGKTTVLRDVDRLLMEIEAIDGVVAATPRNRLGAEIKFEEERTASTVYGIRPDREKEIFTIHQWLVEGSYLDPRDREQIMLGIQLAGADRPDIELFSRSLQKVHAGDEVIVTFANGVEKKYRVKGIFQTQFIQTDIQAFVSELEFRSVSALARNQATFVHVKVRNGVMPTGLLHR